MPRTIAEAMYHQSPSDQSCQVYFTGTGGYDPTQVTTFRFMAGGYAEFELYDKATGKVIRSLTSRFAPIEDTLNQPVADDTAYGRRVGKPYSIPGLVPGPGQSTRLKRVFYDSVFIGDVTNGDGALVKANEDIPQTPF